MKQQLYTLTLEFLVNLFILLFILIACFVCAEGISIHTHIHSHKY